MKYTKEQKEDILARIEDLAQEVGSINKVCRLTGVSAAIMSGIRKGTYSGDEDKQYEVLESYLKVREGAKEVGKCAGRRICADVRIGERLCDYSELPT